MSGEAKLRRKGADQTDGDMNHSQSKEESNGDVRHENGTDSSKHNGDVRHKNGADSSKHNGDTHESNGNKGPKPVNVAKAGLFSKLMMFLMLGSFFLATSIYLVVEYKDGPVADVIHSAISKEYAQVLIHHINDDLAPLVDSIKGSIRDGIQKVTGQDLVGNLEDMEKSKDLKEESLSNVGKKEEGKIETNEQARESKFEKNSKNIRDNIMEETIEVRRNQPIQQDNIKQKEDGKEKEAQKEPTMKVAEEKFKVEKVEDNSPKIKKTEKELNARKETNEKDGMKTKENGKVLEAEKEAGSKVSKDELKLEKADDKTSKEESNLKKTKEEATQKLKKDGLKFQETEDKTSKTSSDESKLKEDTSNIARDKLKKEAEVKHQRKLKNLGTEEESKNINDVKEEVLKVTKKEVVENQKEKLTEEARKGETNK